MLTSGGSPTCTAPPANVSPRKKCRRDTLERLAITCDISPPLPRKLTGTHHRDYHFLEPEIRLAEVLEHAPDQRPVGRCFRAPRHIPEILLDHALLALRAARENRAQLLRRRERRVRNPRHLPRRV